MKKISFDFDGTLSTLPGQKRAKTHIDNGDDVYITTARVEDATNIDLFKVAEKLGIPKDHIRFTEFDDKWKYLKDFNFHFDDDYMEVTLINANSTCIGVLVKYE